MKSNESSGLHDLQALASSTKQRRSQRLSSQMDAQDSLLRSSAALEGVVLPDPNKAVDLPDVVVSETATAEARTTEAESSTSASQLTASAASVDVPKESSSSSSVFLLLGLGAVAIAGAAAFYVMRGGQADSPQSAVPSASIATTEAEPPPTTPQAPVPVMAPDQEETETADPEATEPVADEAAEDSAEEAVDEASPQAAVVAKTDKARQPAVDESKPGKARAVAKAKDDKKSARAAADKKVAKVEKTEEKAPKETPKAKDGASLDDVLSSVTGGIDKPVVEEKKEAPSKKSLGRGDVAKAMKKISPSAKACYSAEEYSGVVKVKYSVAPDGSVSKAAATGAHKSSKTGKCVAAAVKKAKFPAFSGSSMSFSFPFLLSP